MARISIPSDLKGKDLTRFILANKEAILTEKKSMVIKYSDPFNYSSSLLHKEGSTVKALDTVPDNTDVINVKIVGNTANFVDSHKDMLLPDCWKKTINERKGMILHLYDHKHSFDGEIGDATSLYSQEMSLTDLGINKSGTTQVLVMESDVKKSLNEKMFDRYKNKRVKQHSIGMQYVKIALAVNDEESPKEKALWDKYIGQVINKSEAEEDGYFFVVPEIKLYEISAVIFGANSLTPTLETDTKQEPSIDTPAQPFDAKEYIKSLTIKL